MTEVLVCVKVYNRRIRCNQVSDAMDWPILGLLFLFLYSFNLLKNACRLPFACNSASFLLLFCFCNAPGNKCQRKTLSQYFVFLANVKLTSQKKKLTFLTHSISETSKATVDKERFLESGELTL